MRPALLLALLLLLARTALALDPIGVAPDVYMFAGDMGEPSIGNGANTGNAGFIVGQHGVIVIDTGASRRRGEAMIEAIARVTDKPIRLVIVTHAVQEFLFGNAAFAARGIPILAHAKSLELMRSRCEHCLDNLKQLLGESEMAGTHLVLPDRLVADSGSLVWAGRHLQLLHYGWAATPGDLAVFDPKSGVLFAGGLLSAQRVPELRDGKLDAWVDTLDRMTRIPATAIVPGHGPLATPAALTSLRDYLRALDAKVRALYAENRSLLEALDAADLPAYRDWAMYPILHRKNVQQRYLELEVQELEAR